MRDSDCLLGAVDIIFTKEGDMMLNHIRRMRHALATVCVSVLILGMSFDALSAPVVIQMALLLRATGREWQHAVIEEFHKEQDRIRPSWSVRPTGCAMDSYKCCWWRAKHLISSSKT